MSLKLDTLESWLWESAKILRGSTDSSDYKNYIFGLLFLKRTNDTFEEEVETLMVEDGLSREDAEDEAYFSFPPEARWDYLKTQTENIGVALDKAFAAIERDNTSLEGVLTTTKFGDKEKLSDDVLQRLLRHFNTYSLRNQDLESPHILGDAYEYLIKQFADDAGKKGGEFYTPRGVVQLIVQLIKPQPRQKVYDPTVASGGMLIEAANYVSHLPNGKVGKNINISLYGQEKNIGTWAIGKLNMLLHNFVDADIRKGDTLVNPRHTDENELMFFDRVIANPPFSMEEWWTPAETNFETKLDKNGNEVKIKPNYSKVVSDPFGRFRFGIPPRSYADFAFLQHMIATLKNDGIAGVVLPHGTLSRGSSEGKIRRKIIDADLVEAIIGLPNSLFYNTGIPASIWIINKAKPSSKKEVVSFINASYDFIEGRNQNEISQEQINKILDAFNSEADIDGYKRNVSLKEIRSKNYNLNISRYIDTTTPEETVDISKVRLELDEINRMDDEIDRKIENFLVDLRKFSDTKEKDNWELVELSSCLDYIQPTKYIEKKIMDEGSTPVLTANKSFILGYTSSPNNVFKNLPAIIFDDFTTDCKFVDFPFKVRSSALKILVPKREDISVRYVYEAMKTLNYQCVEHKRYWISEYQHLKIPLPPFDIQNRIADILSSVDDKGLLLSEKKEKYSSLKRGIVQELLPTNN